MTHLNEGILQDAVRYFPEIDRTAEDHRKDGQWLRPGSVPMFYPDFGKTSQTVLYVGLNPSLTEKMQNWFIGAHGSDELLNLERLVKMDAAKRDEAIDKLVGFQAALKGRNWVNGGAKRISYFTTLENFHREVWGDSGLGWEHYDIFNYRSTYQEHLRKTLLKSSLRTSEPLRGFFDSSLNRFAELDQTGGFKCVVVFNALASRYLRENNVLELGKKKYGATENIILANQLTVGGTTKQERMELVKQLKSMFGSKG